MALNLEKIRALADRVATSHGLEVVEIEYLGSSKQRALRVFIEKNAEGRAKFLLRRAKGLNTYEAERLRRHIARELRWRSVWPPWIKPRDGSTHIVRRDS